MNTRHAAHVRQGVYLGRFLLSSPPALARMWLRQNPRNLPTRTLTTARVVRRRLAKRYRAAA